MRFTFVILLFCGFGADAQMIIKAHANYRPYAVAAAQNLLLDDYPNATVAYSLRKLDKDYTGSAIRVRRSNDNTEQDIGFTSSGDLDTATLKTFVGAGNNGFVTTWYDQSGNTGRNATQGTAAFQPRIVNAGTVERQNGKVSLFYNGGNDFVINNFTQNNGFYSFFGITSVQNITGNKTVLSGDLQGNPRSAQYITIINSNPRTLAFNVNTAISDLSSSINANQLYLLSGHKYTGFIEAFTNNATNGATTFTNSSNSVNDGMYIGSQVAQSAYMNGYISECIMYGFNNYSNRTGIENNINDYYNIYWNGDFAGLLDSFPSSAAAYSLRNLDKDYLGPLVRVRRSNDNAEQDIYGDYYGNLDTVGLKNFVGANSGFVTTWYDQSGNAINAPQTTAANQPRVVNAGVIDRENSRPTIRYDGTNDHFDLFDVLDIGQNSFLSLSFANITNANATIYAKSIASNSPSRYALISETSIIYSFLHTDIPRHATASGIGKRLYCSQIIRGTSNTLFFNNTQVGQNTSIDNYNMNSNYRFLIGAYNDVSGTGAGFYFLNGTISELVIYLSDQSSNRTGMSNNINTYYSIY
jgi:hypothetical protein